MDKRQLILLLVVIIAFGVAGLTIGLMGFSRTTALIAFAVIAAPLLYLIFSRSQQGR
ncbi:hypothetical protein [Streptomyces sp. MA15]|uniref:hypothetical protein n=1 Tax=unclassified Streptomyces TaxID=2593676 RepID=UPI0025B148B0|nr:hypothetical protein [Streptomyces sp. MA15]MDN3271209.1 hypothetical protein [Streptomyces sp. MA15]